ncbi:hypothetical protein O181_059617 [Austropuccinia psidii MF-1]|uniref:Uncharacterized protein n=1 Tax=Austropuccinia psidii MF-1 TaxID=1389203 RepID=A0A9Q3ELZ6_9BASI|nr:hypothetical protein [Austropuccinia psidii MF-1]
MVLHSLQIQGLGNVASNPPRNDEVVAHPQEIPSGGGNSETLQWMESTIVQTLNAKYKGIAHQKEEVKQGRSPTSFYQKSSIQPTLLGGKKEKERELEDTILPQLHDSLENVFKMARTLMEFKEKEESITRKSSFQTKCLFLLIL